MDLADTNAVLEDLLGVKESTLLDRQIVKRVCELVGIRSARLSAAAVAGVLTRMNKLNGYQAGVFGCVVILLVTTNIVALHFFPQLHNRHRRIRL